MCGMLQARRRAPAGARRVRSALFATTATALALTAHAIGSGARPDTGAVVIVLALIAAAAHAYAGRGVSPAPVVAALATAQLTMHLVLDVSSTHHDVTAGFDPRMLLAHAAATILTAALLTRADDALCSLVRAILPAGLSALPVPEKPDRPAPTPTVDVVRQVVLRVSRPRRGPPCPR